MPPAPKASRWCFTINNYSDNDEATLKTVPYKFICYGKEKGDSGTPHLQGFVSFAQAKTLVAMKKIHPTAHWEKTLGPTPVAISYCKKGEQSHEEWQSLNVKGPNYGLNADVFEDGDDPSETKGKRSDLEDVKEAILSGMTCLTDIRYHFPAAYSKNTRWVKEFINDCAPVIPVEDFPLRPWQIELESYLDATPDSRSILFVVDYVGNQGKSWFSERYRQKYPKEVIKVTPGKKADMVSACYAVGIATPRVVIMDAPRSKQSRKKRDSEGNEVSESALMYDFLEEMKNGEILVSKYESMVWRFPRCHVVVMTNQMPDMTQLSHDRYKFIYTEPSPGYNPPETSPTSEFESYALTGRHDSIPVTKKLKPAKQFVSKPARPSKVSKPFD